MPPATIPAPPPARWTSTLLLAAASLALSLAFFAPRLWIFTTPTPDSTYWQRGLAFVAQVDQPLGSPTERALAWRLAPVVLAKALGLEGRAALVVPWLGLLALLATAATVAQRRFSDPWAAWLLVPLVATTNATLVVTGWLGINDAWFAAALLAAAFVRTRWILLAAFVAGPWVDERFLLGLPLALLVRRRDEPDRWDRVALAAAAGAAPYLALRLLDPFDFALPDREILDSALSFTFVAWLPWAPLGLFMGLRAAWVLVVAAAVDHPTRPTRIDVPLAVAALVPLAVITAVASDTGRAPTLLLPLLFVGARRIEAAFGAPALRRALVALLAANLLLPAMHVTHKNGDIINSLPVELVRLIRHE